MRFLTAIAAALMLCATGVAAHPEHIEDMYTVEGNQVIVPEGQKVLIVPHYWKLQNIKHHTGGAKFPTVTSTDEPNCGTDFGPYDPRCDTEEPVEQCDNYDYYDENDDGVVDYGPAAGCDYDPCVGYAICYD